MLKWCRTSIEKYPETQVLLARYPGDPEALYFDRDHPGGVPVEWEE